MYCRTRENFTTGDTTVGDVDPQEDKMIMLTDKDGNISLVNFSDTITTLQDMINALNETVKTQATTLKRCIKNGDKIQIVAREGLFLNSCGADLNAPCVKTQGGTAQYVSTYNKNPEGSLWTIQKLKQAVDDDATQ